MKLENIKRHDMEKAPYKQNSFLHHLVLFIATIGLLPHKFKLRKINMTSLDEPHLFLFNHMSVYDFMVMAKIMKKRRFNYVVSIDGFLDAKFTLNQEKVMRHYGAITKRKFTNDLTLIKQIKRALYTNKQDVVMYPEARYSLHGSLAVLPSSLGKMIKLFKVPVVVVKMNGNYLADPFWGAHKHKNKAPIEAVATKVLTEKDVDTMEVEEINEIIRNNMNYNEYQYQLEKGYLIKNKKRAEGLHKLLYKCPICHKEYTMSSYDSYLECGNCHSKWYFEENGYLKNIKDNSLIKVIDWYNYERECVKIEVENGTYHFEDDVMVYALPNVKKFLKLGKGHLVHDVNEGFHLVYKDNDNDIDIVRAPLSMYSCHIEYDYRKFGDCLDISTLQDTFFVHPLNYDNVLTKFNFAVEEIYNYHYKKSKEEK